MTAQAANELFDVDFHLTSDEAAFVLRVIGQLPTESNAWPLHQKMLGQYNDAAKKVAEQKGRADE